MPDLRPIHWSMGGLRRQPNNMERFSMPPEMKEGLVNVALSIFTNVSNAGHPFQDALLAIYLSGLHHGASLNNAKTPPPPEAL